MKSNIATQNSHVWKEMHLPNHHFLVSMLVFGGVYSFFRHQTKQIQGFSWIWTCFQQQSEPGIRSGLRSVWMSAHPKRKWLRASQDIYIYIHIYIYTGQPRGVFKGSCHCNPSQKWGTLRSNSRSRCFKQMGCTFFFCIPKLPGESAWNIRGSEDFLCFGEGSNFGRSRFAQKFRDRGTTTDFSRWCFQFFVHFHPYLAEVVQFD